MVRGALFKRTEEEKGLGGWAPVPRRGIRTVGITDCAICDMAIKERALGRTAALRGDRQRRYHPPDALLAFLESL